jgi:hypothetical protein
MIRRPDSAGDTFNRPFESFHVRIVIEENDRRAAASTTGLEFDSPVYRAHI